MTIDRTALEQLNIAIGEAETQGDRPWFEDVIAPKLAFLRASGKFDCRADFLLGVAPSERKTTEVESIHIYGNRAVVTCIVTVHTTSGDKAYHNIRLFIRRDEQWQLMGWANEAV